MEAVLGRQELERELATLPAAEQVLHIDLAGRDPDDGVTRVPYEKGALFLMHIEQVYGRALLDAFLFTWFKEHAFQSVTTAEFRRFLRERLLARDAALAAQLPVEEWLTKPGIPAAAPRIVSEAFHAPGELARRWAEGGARSKADTAAWSTQQWLHFLRALPKDLGAGRMAALDASYGFTRSGNSEILCEWLQAAVRNRYLPAQAKLEQFLTTIGRRKFLKPLYEELVKTPEGRKRAAEIFAHAKSGYHSIAAITIEEILRKAEAQP
jgi:hypothetical protein